MLLRRLSLAKIPRDWATILSRGQYVRNWRKAEKSPSAPGLALPARKLKSLKPFPVSSHNSGRQKGVPGSGVSGMKKTMSSGIE